MEQIGLSIAPKIIYSGDNFVWHSGVREIREEIGLTIEQAGFRTLFIYGGRRTGKSHLSISLCDIFLSNGLTPWLIDGYEIDEVIKEDRLSVVDSKTVLLVDDIDRYFQSERMESSGAFVTFIESIRKSGCLVIFFSSTRLEDCQVDDHILSRLRSAVGLSLKDPEEEEVEELIAAVAMQRGISLDSRKRGYLFKRLPRDLQTIEEYLSTVDTLSLSLGKPIRFRLLADVL